MKRIVLYVMLAVWWLVPATGYAQQYTGLSGLLHVPSAEMNHEGDAFIGLHFLNKAMTPDTGFLFNGQKYDTYDYYIALTPFRWIEFSYVCTKRKNAANEELWDYHRKDRSVSLKIRPLEEGKYYPAVAFGCNDFGTSAFNKNRSDVQLYFFNYYVAATKHFEFGGNEVGVTLAYRHFLRGYNAKWNGVVGGVTFRPSFFPQARAIVEYTGNEVLVGLDALLWRHLRVQASVKDFKYVNVGLCFQMNLLGEKYVY